MWRQTLFAIKKKKTFYTAKTNATVTMLIPNLVSNTHKKNK